MLYIIILCIYHILYINQQHHLYCACISAARARILIRWFANTARGHFLFWNKTEPTALLNQYRGLECYRKPREQTKAFFFQSKSMAKYFCSWFINLRRPGKQTRWQMWDVTGYLTEESFLSGLTYKSSLSLLLTYKGSLLTLVTSTLLHLYTSKNITSTRHLFLRFISKGFPTEMRSEIGREISCTEREGGKLDTLGI